jgi:lysozyme
MQYSKNGLLLTERFEGCRLEAYQDIAGVWTIGYGHTDRVRPGDICSQVQAEAWLMLDIRFAASEVNRLVTVPLTQDQFDALTDFVFNLGTGNFEHSTLLRLLNARKFKEAGEEFRKWGRAGGKEVAGLLARRKAEEGEFNG